MKLRFRAMGPPRARLSLAHMMARVETLALALARELARLNSGFVGKDRLSKLDRRERVRAIKSALAERHRGPTRCC